MYDPPADPFAPRYDEMEMPACPDCGHRLMIDPRAIVQEERGLAYHDRALPIPVKHRTVPIACCTGCEFTIILQAY